MCFLFTVLYVSGKPALVTLDYLISTGVGSEVSEFRLSYYPHKLSVFKTILKDIFGQTAKHVIYGDFKELSEVENPAFLIHVVEKNK